MQPNNQPADGNWEYRSEQSEPIEQEYTPQQLPSTGLKTDMPAQLDDTITWTASEFISHHKDARWYVLVSGGGAVFGTAVYLLTRDLMSTIVIFIVVILFVIISANKPRQLTYTIDPRGISIGEKFYPFSLFKSFAIIRDGAISSINLVPLKRFMPELTIYYAPDDESRIIDVLVHSLPNDQKSERITDRFMKRIRF